MGFHDLCDHLVFDLFVREPLALVPGFVGIYPGQVQQSTGTDSPTSAEAVICRGAEISRAAPRTAAEPASKNFGLERGHERTVRRAVPGIAQCQSHVLRFFYFWAITKRLLHEFIKGFVRFYDC